MVVSEDVLRIIREKADLYEATKERIKEKIRAKINIAVKKLELIQSELLEEVDEELRENPFADFLSTSTPSDSLTDIEAKNFLAREKIPESFGPDDKSLSLLLMDIDSFRAWRNKRNPFDSVPKGLKEKSTTHDSIAFSWDAVNRDCIYEIELRSSSTLKSNHYSEKPEYTFYDLKPGTGYHIRVRAIVPYKEIKCMWSSPIVIQTKDRFYRCAWKECAGNVSKGKKYNVAEENLKIATKINESINYSTIIGNTFIQANAAISWHIKILNSKNKNGYRTYIGIAPSDINQNNDDNFKECGWYFGCYSSSLWSGPPHNYENKEYGPIKEKDGEYVHTGDSVGVAMDTQKGELSFILNGVNLGVAYEGIPLDKPLVPCVILYYNGDSVELDTSEVKENEADGYIPIPSIITTKSITWNSITLTWGEVAGASFYQIETDGSKCWDASTTNSFTKRGLLPETEHSFKVRAVRGSSVSEWSDVVKGRISKKSFETSWWKDCPDNVDEKRKYAIDKRNPRIAIKINSNGYYSTIIGNTFIQTDAVTSWYIRILKSKDKNGKDINIGVAPFGINQDKSNYNACGWYFDCYRSSLWSGPPHNYEDKEYGPRKENEQYVHTGDSVGVAMDTTKSELSFILHGVNLGVAYKGIPLDKPLVPCVILRREGDSVELVI